MVSKVDRIIVLFERVYEEFKLHNTRAQAKELLSLYKGEYLSCNVDTYRTLLHGFFLPVNS
jgi:hypothetical protein